MDFVTATARLLTDTSTSGASTTQAGFEPVWRPGSLDALLYPAPAAEGGSVIELLPPEETLHLPDFDWPARFDATGSVIYAVVEDETLIAVAENGDILARWPGVPATRWWEGAGTGPQTIIAIDGAPAAILAPPLGNQTDLVINHAAHPAGATYVERAARGAVWAPDAMHVALAMGNAAEGTWTIAVLDATSGDLRELATLPAPPGPPPSLIWNETGTHILVHWPGPSGI